MKRGSRHLEMVELTEEKKSLAAVRMLSEYRSEDGRRCHPDDTLAMIRSLIDIRHPHLSHNASEEQQ